MNQKEIANTYALIGGTQAWHNAGYPMEGAAPGSAALTTPVPGEPVRIPLNDFKPVNANK